MVQSVKGLLCKPGDLSSDPQPPTQKTGPAPGTQSWGGGGDTRRRALPPASPLPPLPVGWREES